MKIHVLADLHLEFGPVAIPAIDADVIVLAGDIDIGVHGIKWALHHFPNRPVIYVLGNHAFYRHDILELRQTINHMAEGTNVGVLENTAVEIDGFSCLGCTLWTDFSLRGNAEYAMANAERLMNDFRLISNGSGQRARSRSRAVASRTGYGYQGRGQYAHQRLADLAKNVRRQFLSAPGHSSKSYKGGN